MEQATKQAVQTAEDFVKAAKETLARRGGNHSESMFADGDLQRMCGLGFDEHWLIPAGAVVLQEEPTPTNARQVVQGTLSGSVTCAVSLIQIKHPNECRKYHNDTTGNVVEFLNEVRLARLMRHPNITLFFGFVLIYHPFAKYIGMVHEWIPGCTLEVYVVQRAQLNRSTDHE